MDIYNKFIEPINQTYVVLNRNTTSIEKRVGTIKNHNISIQLKYASTLYLYNEYVLYPHILWKNNSIFYKITKYDLITITKTYL